MLDVADPAVAVLVRLRMTVERSHGWVLLACIFLTLASVVLVGAAVKNPFTFGAYAAAVAASTVGLGFVSERLCYGFFRSRARAAGLSEAACEGLFRAAADAEHWLDVLRACGHEPSDAEIAGFIRSR